MTLRPLCLGFFCLLILGSGCHSTTPWAESFSPTDFRSGWPPVAQARVVNVGHVDPNEVYERDFGDTSLVGADLVLMRRQFDGTESRTTYDAYPASRRSSVVINEADGRRTRVTTDTGPNYVPRTRTQRRYTFTGVFLRTDAARDAGLPDER